ncbi:MAG: tetratricopeptide repeat protein [Treponema sp.]|jgi:predicted negative regulator of RcsB-dependent stress response|nr:tetratricopeptide repeat protein [Treponema sp.]
MAAMEEKKEKRSFSDGLADFIQNNRKGLLIAMVVILALTACFVVGYAVRSSLREKATRAVEEFARRYEVLVIDINEPEKAEDTQALLDELDGFAKKNSGYAGARAWSLAASIYTEQKNWALAESAWRNSAKKAGNSYLAPVSLFNAAVAAEEQGNLDEAVGLYAESAAHVADFPAAARAQFAIGRIREAQGDTQAALEAYKAIPEQWSNESTWINLAQSRIIVLSNSGSE